MPVLWHNFAVEVKIQSFDFNILGNTKADGLINHFKDEETYNAAPCGHDDDAFNLDEQLVGVAFNQACRAAPAL